MASDISATYRVVATPPPPCDNTAVYFALSAYIIALLPHAFLGFSALGILCLLLALWRVVVQHRGKTAPSLDMTTVLGVAALVILIGFGQMRLTPSTGVAALITVTAVVLTRLATILLTFRFRFCFRCWLLGRFGFFTTAEQRFQCAEEAA